MDTKALRQKILDLAIRGKLVPQDPNDEPASVLLERIREQKKQMVKEGKLKSKDIKNDSVIFVGEDSLHYEKFQDGTVKCIEDEIPFEVPEGWEWCRLNSVVDVRDGTHDTPAYVDKGIPLITSKNLIEGGIDYSNVKYISEEDAFGINERSGVNVGDILFAMIGTIGNPSMVTEDILISIKNVALFKFSFSDNLNNYFIMHYLDYAQEDMKKRPSGGLQPFVSLNFLRTYLVPIPPVEEQHRIVSILTDSIDSIRNIDILKNDLAISLEKAKSKILDLAIRGKLVTQDPNDEPASVLLERIHAEKEELIKQGKIKRDKKESIIFRGDDNSYYLDEFNEVTLPFDIPDNWIWVSHNELYEISGGSQPPKSKFSDVMKENYVRLYQIRDYGEHPVPVYIPEKLASKKTKKGDILLARYGASLGKVFWAEDGAYNVAMAKVEAKFLNGILPEYMFYFYHSRIYKECIFSVSRTAQAGFNKEDLNNLYIPLPPLEEQKRIILQVSSVLSKLDIISNTLL